MSGDTSISQWADGGGGVGGRLVEVSTAEGGCFINHRGGIHGRLGVCQAHELGEDLFL